MIRFHFSGTAAGVPDPERLYTGTVVETDDAVILIDAGDGTSLSFSRSKLDWKRVKALFITHDHYDHTSGLHGVLCCMPQGAEVWFSQELTGSRCAAWQTLYPHLKFNSLCHNFSTEICGLRVTALKNDHLASGQSYSFEIMYQNKRILYSGDIGNILLERYFWSYAASPCDLLIMESAHIMPRTKLLEKLLGCRCRQLVFNHIWRETVLNFDVEEYLKNALPYPLCYATDGSFSGFDDDGNYICGERSDLKTALTELRRFSDTELENIFDSEGTPCHWKILGPFENRFENNSHTALHSSLVEQVLADTSCSMEYRGIGGRPVVWQEAGARDMTPRGLLPFAWIYPELEMCCFGAAGIKVENSGDYRIFWGSDNGCRIFIDSVEYVCDDLLRGAQKDQYSKVIHLEKGVHRLLVVHATVRGGWGVHFRIVPERLEK